MNARTGTGIRVSVAIALVAASSLAGLARAEILPGNGAAIERSAVSSRRLPPVVQPRPQPRRGLSAAPLRAEVLAGDGVDPQRSAVSSRRLPSETGPRQENNGKSARARSAVASASAEFLPGDTSERSAVSSRRLAQEVKPRQERVLELAAPIPIDEPPDAVKPSNWLAGFSLERFLPAPPQSSRRNRPGLDRLLPICDDCPSRGMVGFVGYDAWRGISDGSWENNGIHAGLNYGTRLGELSDLTGVGFQMGGSVGVFNWSGTDYRLTDNNTAQTQGFLTYGFFRKANENSRWNAALVQDWMFNDNFGVYAQNPTLSQLRVQLGYALNASNELGMWGAWRVMEDTRLVGGEGLTTWRSINQLNAYWHRKWTAGGADTMLWFGVPERDRLGGSGSLGDYLAGALANVPLNDRVGLYSLVTYMHPSARPGPAASREDAWNFTIGLTFFPLRNARSTTVAGQCWMPQLPVANNGLFLVDTNRQY